MLKTQRNVTGKLVMHKSSTRMARTSSTIFTHKNSITGSIVKHTCKDNKIKQVSHSVKQSRLAQFLRRLTTLTSVLQDKALRIMLVPHCPLSIFIPHNQDYEAMLKTKRNVTRKLVIHKSSTHMARTSSTHFYT